MSNQDTTENKAKFFTRGGQITFHNIRMFVQINKNVGHWCIWMMILLTALTTWLITSSDTISAVYYYLAAKVCSTLYMRDHIFHIMFHGKILTLSPAAVLSEAYFQNQLITFYAQLKIGFYISLVLSMVLMIWIMVWLTKRGKAQASNKFIRGTRLASSSDVAEIIKKQGKNSDIVISGVPMINRFEVQHTLLHGTVGAGKGQTFNQFLTQIKRRGDRAIVYDKGCVFTSNFFDHKKDVILNPFDARCANWDLWREAIDGADFENLAESLIPMHGETDPFWVNAARTIFGSSAYTMQDDPDRSIDRLLKLVLTAELDELTSYLQGTEAATLVSEKIEKTAISIRSVITTYLKSLRFLRGLEKSGKPPFAMRDWIKNENHDGWLFISSNAEQHSALRPLISMWLSMASISLLSLPENYNRRIWFICDELPTLHKLPQLPETIAEVRKFGGCFVLGMQSYAQLEKVYGTSAAKEMFDLLNTRFFFRSPSSNMARLVSQELGDQEIDQSRENYSYGANTIRDGISIGNQRVTQPIVTAAEVMDMEDLTAYLRVPFSIPVCKLNVKFKKLKEISEGFIKRDIKMDPFIEAKIEAIAGAANKAKKDAQNQAGVVKKKVAETAVSDKESLDEIIDMSEPSECAVSAQSEIIVSDAKSEVTKVHVAKKHIMDL